MKRVLLACTSALALASVMTPAAAADLGRRIETRVPAAVMAPVAYNWTGLYVGLSGGGAWGSSDWGTAGITPLDYDVSGGLIGGTVGYNLQMGQWVFGLEGDLSWTNIDGTATCTFGVCNTENSWLGTVRGRIGMAFDRFMPYITGGVAFGDVQANLTGLGQTSDTNAGWTIGAGLEFAVVGPWTAKVEYLYVDLGDIGCGPASCGGATPTGVDFTTNIVRVGLNYRF
jgi:outer membrane immunogenic protein